MFVRGEGGPEVFTFEMLPPSRTISFSILGVTVIGVVLPNGKRMIDGDSFKQLVIAMGSRSILSLAELDEQVQKLNDWVNA